MTLNFRLDLTLDNKFAVRYSSILRNENILFLYAAEIKHQRGTLNLDTTIHNYTTHEYLRDENHGGGLILWTKKQTGAAVRPWSPKQDAPEWMNSERSWIVLQFGTHKIACCGLYLRTESPQNSENFKQNEQILQQLSKEKQDLEEQGYIVSLLGDFNARITPDDHFTFTKYPHKANNNGGLLNNFAKSNGLYCMNPMKWKNKAEESYTYQRDLGIRYDRSIIDYGLGTMEAISLTTSFTIQDSSDFSVESDHSSLLWEFDVELLNHKVKVELIRNPLKKIRKWQSYTKILESRLSTGRVDFDGMTSVEQANYLTTEFCKAGTSVIPTTTPNQAKKARQSAKLLKLLAKSKSARRSLKIYPDKTDQEFTELKLRAKSASVKAKTQYYKESFNTKRKVKLLLNKKGPKAQKLFWELTNPKPRKSSGIEALESNGILTTNPAEMNELVETFFETKFKTVLNKEEIEWSLPDMSKLGEHEKRMDEITAEALMEPITLTELSVTLDKLDTSKAEGMDGITNEMLRNTGPVARQKLLEMLNNTMISGRIPDSWKEGDVALILKKPPQTDISNYRPITLISCISKLVTKILAQRISLAVEKDDLMGPEQNGFRANRSCSDNIFILNSILEMNKSKKKLSYLIFVDLKEAYDRVDRNILFARLQQLKFPDKLIAFLRNYYFQDNISTSSTGERSRKQYQQRGLRQGCNLSSVLFIIYVAELARRVKTSGHGVKLESGEVVGILLFADDIILIANTPESLERLKGVLETWCSDYKMVVSVSKTNVISPDEEYTCSVSSTGDCEADAIAQVESYKYLGVQQYLETHRTSRHKGEDMLKRANIYKNVILSSRKFLPD